MSEPDTTRKRQHILTDFGVIKKLRSIVWKPCERVQVENDDYRIRSMSSNGFDSDESLNSVSSSDSECESDSKVEVIDKKTRFQTDGGYDNIDNICVELLWSSGRESVTDLSALTDDVEVVEAYLSTHKNERTSKLFTDVNSWVSNHKHEKLKSGLDGYFEVDEIIGVSKSRNQILIELRWKTGDITKEPLDHLEYSWYLVAYFVSQNRIRIDANLLSKLDEWISVTSVRLPDYDLRSSPKDDCVIHAISSVLSNVDY